MAHADDPPWLRPAPTVVLSTNPDGGTSISPKTSEAAVPPAPPPSSNMPPALTKSSQPTQPTTYSVIASTSKDDYAGWKPQPIAPQQTAQAPPLSPPLDLAMYPGAPVDADPATVRKAVAGLKPLRILSSRRPGGPSSAGPSRPPSVNSTPSSSGATRSGFMSLISAAKRASSIATSGPSSSPSPQASTHSLSVSRAPIPVSPLPPPRTPPLVPSLRIAPELSNQVEPSLKAYLETLIAQAASKPSSSVPSAPRRDSDIHAANTGPIGLTEDDADILLEIRDLDAGQVISIRDLDAEAVNRESQSMSQRSPSISEFMVVRDLDAQPRTPPTRLSVPQTPPRSTSLTQLLSPIHLAPDPRRSRLPSPVTPFTEAAYLNRNLEASLFDLECALGYKPQPLSRSDSVSTFSSAVRSRRNDPSRAQVSIPTPRTARTTSSHHSSVFSSRTVPTPLTTPPSSPPPLPQPFTKKAVELPCMVCSRPMQKMTSTRCGHVFCRGCVEGRSACPVCRASVKDTDLRAIHLYV